MQKWEYLFVKAEDAGKFWIPRYVNDGELPNWKNGKPLHEYANQLGRDGWELVAAPYVGGAGYGTTPRLIFKRPIP